MGRRQPVAGGTGGEPSETASRYLRGVASSSGRARLRHTVWPRGFAASVRLVAKLERLTVSPTDSPSGRGLRAHLEERRYGIPSIGSRRARWSAANSSQVYLRGRHKQAVRTNLHRAREQRLQPSSPAQLPGARGVDQPDRPGDLTDSWERKLLIGRPESAWWAVFDAEGPADRTRVVSPDSGRGADLERLVCRGHSGRWLLHTEIVSEMAKRGVTCLLVAAGMAPVMPPGQQYFQRLLGYKVAHLKLR